MYKIITLCILTTTFYFATMSTLNYCKIICAWAGGLIFRIFRNKTIYMWLIPCLEHCENDGI